MKYNEETDTFDVASGIFIVKTTKGRVHGNFTIRESMPLDFSIELDFMENAREVCYDLKNK